MLETQTSMRVGLFFYFSGWCCGLWFFVLDEFVGALTQDDDLRSGMVWWNIPRCCLYHVWNESEFALSLLDQFLQLTGSNDLFYRRKFFVLIHHAESVVRDLLNSDSVTRRWWNLLDCLQRHGVQLLQRLSWLPVNFQTRQPSRQLLAVESDGRRQTNHSREHLCFSVVGLIAVSMMLVVGVVLAFDRRISW